MRAQVGETFDVVLEGNATAGYRWELAKKEGGPDRVALLDETWAGDTSRAGGPTKQRFRFRADDEGPVTLVFHYRRPWEKVPPSDAKSIRVDIGRPPSARRPRGRSAG